MRLYIFTLLVLVAFSSCAQNEKNNELDTLTKDDINKDDSILFDFILGDYFKENNSLNVAVNAAFAALDDTAKIAQLIMPAMGEHGQPKNTIDGLVKDRLVGGILMLNGTVDEFASWILAYNELNKELSAPPFLFSADAEPSLVNRKIKNSTIVAKANTLKTIGEVKNVAETITQDLVDIGINYNFAPVVDMSPNKTVGWRSFGHQPDSVIPWSNEFVKTTQNGGVIATAKHFPGHGFVQGDTHKKLVYIDGELKEVKNYPPLIADGLISIMIAHIAIKNNEQFQTNDLPATVSRNIVTGLLRDSLGFNGLIVTDALNMGGVTFVENAALKTIMAGCDIALMPLDARKAHAAILNEYATNESFAMQVDESIKRVLRAKISFGLYRN